MHGAKASSRFWRKR